MKRQYHTSYYSFNIADQKALDKLQTNYSTEFTALIDRLSTISRKTSITHDIRWGEIIFTNEHVNFSSNISKATQRQRIKRTRDLFCKAFGLTQRSSKPNGYKYKVVKIEIVKLSQFEGLDFKALDEKNLSKSVTNYNLENKLDNSNKELGFEKFLETRKIDLDKTSKNKLIKKIQNNNIYFGMKWLHNLFKEFEKAVANGHKLKYCIDVFCKSKYYQFKASAFKLPNYKLNRKNQRTEDIYKAARACGFNINERKQQSRSDDIYKAMEVAGLLGVKI